MNTAEIDALIKILSRRTFSFDPRPQTDIMRTGRMVFKDEYENVLLLPELAGLTAPVRTIAAGEVFRGTGALELTTNGAQWATSAFDYYITGHLVNKNTLIGIAGWFCYVAGNPALEYDLFLDDGTNRHEMKMRFNRVTATLEYYDTTPAYVAVPGGGIANMAFSSYYWYYMKAVFDPMNDQYEWVYFADLLLDLSALTGETAGNNARTFTVGGQNTAQTAAVATACLDDLIVTINEPTYAELRAMLEYEDLMA